MPFADVAVEEAVEEAVEVTNLKATLRLLPLSEPAIVVHDLRDEYDSLSQRPTSQN